MMIFFDGISCFVDTKGFIKLEASLQQRKGICLLIAIVIIIIIIIIIICFGLSWFRSSAI